MALMVQKSIRPSHPAMIIHSVSKAEDQWVIEAESHAMPRCPSCGTVSNRKHSSYQLSLRDLPIQGVPVVIRLRVRKWRCEAPACKRSIFAERLPGLAAPHAHQSDAIADILAVMGHGAGGEASRRLLARLGVVVSGDTVLRHLKRRAQRAVRSEVIEPWSNAQTEGQINRLKTLKRAMFGHANTELLSARLLPLSEIADHRGCG